MTLYRWKCACDDKSCTECRNMDGRKLSDLEVKQGMCPPLHGDDASGPGCRCVLVPVRGKRKLNTT